MKQWALHKTENIIFHSGVSYLYISIFEGLGLSDLFSSSVLTLGVISVVI